MALVIPMVLSEKKTQVGPNLVPKKLPARYAKEGRWSHVASDSTIDETTGKAVQQTIEFLGICTLIGDNTNQARLLGTRYSLRGLAAVWQVDRAGLRPGNRPACLRIRERGS